ncbi:MAG TPA: YihY/virulence factor BrkB family protein [Gemmatimonadaceae bacterium]|nr:YihY/virulence factor BrkB family protein [Gemmatimonadaceae bacterium]
MSNRPLPLRLAWTLRDYAKRVWDNAGEDNIFFLASGIAFSIILAAVPFVLLVVSGIAYILDQSAAASSAEITEYIRWLLPAGISRSEEESIYRVLADIIDARGAVGFWSLIGFIWFTTRLFGALRTALGEIFDIEQERGIIAGKLFDAKITVIATLLIVAYTTLSAYLAIASSRFIPLLTEVGLRSEVMGRLEYRVGQVLALAVITLMFYALYKYLPNRRIRWQTALIAAAFTSVCLEFAKYVFGRFVAEFSPGSFYTGTLYAVAIVVFWVYYAALIFTLGGEVAQVYELRRVKRLQRETFEVAPHAGAHDEKRSGRLLAVGDQSGAFDADG